MEPREVKDRILENISLSVKKVSAASFPAGVPSPPRPPRPLAALIRARVPPAAGTRVPALPLRAPGGDERPGAPGRWRGSGAAHVSAAASELFLKNKVEVSILGASPNLARGPALPERGQRPSGPPLVPRSPRQPPAESAASPGPPGKQASP
ncbi:hypothetical protein P7K49_015509 [Saguinus oedipus]|uniref:Uncharacterized protein n=1 Tax=Saguinus oedipus TaxID=9490 RepID=A0ABQ9V9G4_SAGOE|nr:hypothetical protein P7K49_015509 [Saguinus oedipus]